MIAGIFRRSIRWIEFWGRLGCPGWNPPCTNKYGFKDTIACRYLQSPQQRSHSLVLVSYTSTTEVESQKREALVPGVPLVRPPTMNMRGPTNCAQCWNLQTGQTPEKQGALTQSTEPSLCLLRPQQSFRATWIFFTYPVELFFLIYQVLPPKTTIIPLVSPSWHSVAEWQTRGAGTFPLNSYFSQRKGPSQESILTIQTSQTIELVSVGVLLPMFPPMTIMQGLEKIMVWPYLLPGVTLFSPSPTLKTLQRPDIYTLSYIISIMQSQSSESPTPIPLAAPPKRISYPESIPEAAWAALADGTYPVEFNFFHLERLKSNKQASLVITNLPDSPMAPPKRRALAWGSRVKECPNRGEGRVPWTFNSQQSSLLIIQIIINGDDDSSETAPTGSMCDCVLVLASCLPYDERNVSLLEQLELLTQDRLQSLEGRDLLSGLILVASDPLAAFGPILEPGVGRSDDEDSLGGDVLMDISQKDFGRGHAVDKIPTEHQVYLVDLFYIEDGSILLKEPHILLGLLQAQLLHVYLILLSQFALQRHCILQALPFNQLHSQLEKSY